MLPVLPMRLFAVNKSLIPYIYLCLCLDIDERCSSVGRYHLNRPIKIIGLELDSPACLEIANQLLLVLIFPYFIMMLLKTLKGLWQHLFYHYFLFFFISPFLSFSFNFVVSYFCSNVQYNLLPVLIYIFLQFPVIVLLWTLKGAAIRGEGTRYSSWLAHQIVLIFAYLIAIIFFCYRKGNLDMVTPFSAIGLPQFLDCQSMYLLILLQKKILISLFKMQFDLQILDHVPFPSPLYPHSIPGYLGSGGTMQFNFMCQSQMLTKVVLQQNCETNINCVMSQNYKVLRYGASAYHAFFVHE